MNATPRELPPEIPGFEILGPAGRGAYGTVWVARDPAGGLHALKAVETVAEISRRESQALALVLDRLPVQPHLVRITYATVGPGLVYAMELADALAGREDDPPSYCPDTLSARVASHGHFPLAEAVALALDLLSALGALHAVGVVHRDVKPANVLFVGGVVKLADIGLAAVDRTSLSVAGTPGYLPLDGSTGPDADLYALGKLLYQIVTGRTPAEFPSVPAPLILGSDAAAFRRLNPVLLRACAATCHERFRSAREMQVALEAVLHPPRRWTGRRVLRGVLTAAAALILVAGSAVVGKRSYEAFASLPVARNEPDTQSAPPATRPVPPRTKPNPAPAKSVRKPTVVEKPLPSQAPPPRPIALPLPVAKPVIFRPGEDTRAAQDELARRLGIPRLETNSAKMSLVLIPAGEFQMGSPEREAGHGVDETLHDVRISRPFYVGQYETTQAEYQQVMGRNPSRFGSSSKPVEQFSWDDAVAFCRKLSLREGKRYRLPTEAEWEYSCRAGTTTRTYRGATIGKTAANSASTQTQPVGQYPANPFGLFDMVGNVNEWCADWYSADYYAKSPPADPTGPATGQERVIRGGGWFDGPGTKEPTDRRLRSACRNKDDPARRFNRHGFHVVLEIDSPPSEAMPQVPAAAGR